MKKKRHKEHSINNSLALPEAFVKDVQEKEFKDYSAIELRSSVKVDCFVLQLLCIMDYNGFIRTIDFAPISKKEKEVAERTGVGRTNKKKVSLRQVHNANAARVYEFVCLQNGLVMHRWRRAGVKGFPRKETMNLHMPLFGPSLNAHSSIRILSGILGKQLTDCSMTKLKEYQEMLPGHFIRKYKIDYEQQREVIALHDLKHGFIKATTTDEMFGKFSQNPEEETVAIPDLDAVLV